MSSWDKVGKDVDSGPLGAFKWLVITVVFVGLLATGTRYLGMWGNTVMERVVMKNSFQYVEGMEQRAAILQAQIAQVNLDIMKNPNQRQELLLQKKVLEVQLNAITINQ
jgi:hypothetical protein